MTWVAAGVAIYGALSSGNAADAQIGAAGAAGARSEAQYQQTRSDLAPYRNTGAAANARLAALLGIGGGGGVAPVAPNRNDFMRKGAPVMIGGSSDGRAPGTMVQGMPSGGGFASRLSGGTGGFDQAGYDAAMQKYNQDLAAYQGSQSAGAGVDQGSLLKPFTGADLANEPGYQFGLSEGQKAIDRAAAANGRYDSGATLKALSRYGNDYAGTKFNEAFGRDQSNKNMTYNFLSGMQNLGQNSAVMTGNAGANAAGAQGQYLTNAGDASAAGYIGGAKALTGGLNSYLNYQNNSKTLDFLRNKQSGNGGWGSNSITLPAYGNQYNDTGAY
jgi:hypothetical protein